MDPAIRLRRHTQLWESGTTTVRRIALSGVIFAVVVLLNVIQPYYLAKEDEAELSAETEKEQTEVNSQLTKVNSQLASLDAIDSALGDLKVVLDNPPWKTEIENLKRYFREDGGSQPPATQQAEANRTIKEIARRINAEAIAPLSTKLDAVEMLDELVRLKDLPGDLETGVQKWESENLNKTWYRSTDNKDMTLDTVGAALTDLQNQADETVEALRGPLSSAATALSEFGGEDGEISVQREELEARKEQLEKRYAALQVATDSALPSWAGGLVTTDDMVKWYPWILVAFAVYLVGSALVAAHHFDRMADLEGWSAEERAEPILSSPWTLIRRGPLGTAVTALCYVAVLTTLLVCLYRSANPPKATEAAAVTATTDNANTAAQSISTVDLSILLAYTLLVLALLIVVAKLWPKRAE